MNFDERDALFSAFQEANEQMKRNNFNAIMDGLEAGLIKDLDKAYVSDNKEEYKKIVANIKSRGIKVFRNSEGKHKVKFI